MHKRNSGDCKHWQVLYYIQRCAIVQDLLIRHTLDIMHVECNMMDNLLQMLMGEKDMVGMWEDMGEAHICPSISLQDHPNIPRGMKLKIACSVHVLSSNEWVAFLLTIGKLRMP